MIIKGILAEINTLGDQKEKKIQNGVGTRGMDTWNRLVGARGDDGRGDWINKLKRLAKEQICVYRGHGQVW